MGEFVNTRLFNFISWVFTFILILLTLLLLVSTLFPEFSGSLLNSGALSGQYYYA